MPRTSQQILNDIILKFFKFGKFPVNLNSYGITSEEIELLAALIYRKPRALKGILQKFLINISTIKPKIFQLNARQGQMDPESRASLLLKKELSDYELRSMKTQLRLFQSLGILPPKRLSMEKMNNAEQRLKTALENIEIERRHRQRTKKPPIYRKGRR